MTEYQAHEEIFWRQQSFFQPSWFPKPIHIVGAGALGSHIADTVANMGFKDITVYDYDIVEAHNISNQLYGLADIGKKKVDCLAKHIKEKIGLDIKTVDDKISNIDKLSGILILGVDNMASRKELMFNASKSTVYRAIDARMAIDHGVIYQLDPTDKYQFRKWLSEWFPDEEAEESVCSLRASSMTAKMIAALVTGTVVLLAQQYARSSGIQIPVDTEKYTISNKIRCCIDGTNLSYTFN